MCGMSKWKQWFLHETMMWKKTQIIFFSKWSNWSCDSFMDVLVCCVSVSCKNKMTGTEEIQCISINLIDIVLYLFIAIILWCIAPVNFICVERQSIFLFFFIASISVFLFKLFEYRFQVNKKGLHCGLWDA